jgi:general secretion pathway protein I
MRFNPPSRARHCDPRRGSIRDISERHLGNRGFTLIEVMIALAITLIAVAVLFGGIVSSLRAAQKTAALERAISRAESHLAAIGDQNLVPGERRGEDGDGYRWRTNIAFLGSAPAPNTARKGPWARGTGLFAVSITITWDEGSAEHSFVLDSARLAAVPGSAP